MYGSASESVWAGNAAFAQMYPMNDNRPSLKLGRVMAKTKTKSWDAAEHLKTDEDMAAYLEAALEGGDSALVSAALGDIARAKGVTEIARETGLGRESLYKALSPEANPEFSTVLKVVRAPGFRLHATAEH